MIDAERRAARNSIGDALRRVTAKNRTKPALIWKDRSWTFELLETASLRVAERLAALGLRKGDRVAAFGRNSDAYLLLWLACAQSGLIHVPANYGLTGSELRYILEQSGARALIVDKALAGHVDSVRDMPEIHFIGQFEGGGDIDVLDSALNAIGDPRREWEVSGADYCQIIYTSGTTGFPKGGLMTHSALLAQYMSCIHGCEYVESDYALFALPLYHAGQLHTFTMPQLLVGSSTVLIEQPEARDRIRRSRTAPHQLILCAAHQRGSACCVTRRFRSPRSVELAQAVLRGFDHARPHSSGIARTHAWRAHLQLLRPERNRAARHGAAARRSRRTSDIGGQTGPEC